MHSIAPNGANNKPAVNDYDSTEGPSGSGEKVVWIAGLKGTIIVMMLSLVLLTLRKRSQSGASYLAHQLCD